MENFTEKDYSDEDIRRLFESWKYKNTDEKTTEEIRFSKWLSWMDRGMERDLANRMADGGWK